MATFPPNMVSVVLGLAHWDVAPIDRVRVPTFTPIILRKAGVA